MTKDESDFIGPFLVGVAGLIILTAGVLAIIYSVTKLVHYAWGC